MWAGERSKCRAHGSGLSDLTFSATPEGASGSCYLLLLKVGVRPATIAPTGTYEGALVKTAQGWRFKSRVVHADAAARPAAQLVLSDSGLAAPV